MAAKREEGAEHARRNTEQQSQNIKYENYRFYSLAALGNSFTDVFVCCSEKEASNTSIVDLNIYKRSTVTTSSIFVVPY